MFYMWAVEIPADRVPAEPEGDGSPMEEGATLRWLEIEKAIDAAVKGELPDAKTELVLRRLRDHLGPS
jgi:ADP-ribose pyrophosphatase